MVDVDVARSWAAVELEHRAILADMSLVVAAEDPSERSFRSLYQLLGTLERLEPEVDGCAPVHQRTQK